MISTRTRAELALLFTCLVWSLTYPFIRIVIAEMSLFATVFWRCFVAAIIFSPFVFFIAKNRKNILSIIPMALILSSLFFISYYSQSMGLQTTSSGRSSFITNLSVIIVPFLSPIFGRGFPKQEDFESCFIALVGLFFLSNPFDSQGISVGDIWILVCAFSLAVHVHVLQKAMEKYKNETTIAFLQVAFVAIITGMFFPLSNEVGFLPKTTLGWIALAYLSAFAMVVTTWLQLRYQYRTTPERAAVIYVLEPVFASLFGFFILNEHYSIYSLVGGVIMIFAVLWPHIAPRIRLRYLLK
jgi:drug/metabolite transporter (DMT)-like permease